MSARPMYEGVRPYNDFIMTPQEARRFRRIERIKGMLFLCLLVASIFVMFVIAKNVHNEIRFDQHHYNVRGYCANCETHGDVLNTLRIPVGTTVEKFLQDNPHIKCKLCGVASVTVDPIQKSPPSRWDLIIRGSFGFPVR